ncbi:MAG: alpha/beta fold hydrolase [Bauldia sp.]
MLISRQALPWLLCLLLALGASSGARAGANGEWERYRSGLADGRLQPDCAPLAIEPPAGGQRRGAVFLVHGFTACPQQFFEWGGLLAERGWTVYLFLLPGEGRRRHPDGSDDLAAIPGDGDFGPYSELAQSINRVARNERLNAADPSQMKLVVGGLSIGAVVALEAAMLAPDDARYDRAILFSPTFSFESFRVRVLSPIATILDPKKLPVIGQTGLARAAPSFGDILTGWGEGCERETVLGRAGVCRFTYGMVGTAQRYGTAALQLAASHRLNGTAVQIVGVAGDPVASNSATYEVVRSLGQASACLYRSPANHSLLSRYDSPWENKFWLSSLLADATAFVDAGAPIPRAQGTNRLIDLRYPECRSTQTP